MKISNDEMMLAMSGVSEQLITESMDVSRVVRERFVTRISTIAASVALVAAAGLSAFVYSKSGGILTPLNTASEEETRAYDEIVSTNVTTATLDDFDIEITWGENAFGDIVSAEVTASGDHKVELEDAQGRYYEKMLLLIDDAFFVECGIRTGEINDFMRGEYSFPDYDAILTWETLEDAAVPARWCYDDSGRYLIALIEPKEKYYNELSSPDYYSWRTGEHKIYSGAGELLGLWMYDYNDSALTRAELPTKYTMQLLPVNLSGDGFDSGEGLYALLWYKDFVITEGYGADPDGIVEVREAAWFFPDMPEYNVSANDYTNRSIMVLLDYGGRRYVQYFGIDICLLESRYEDGVYVRTAAFTVDGTDIEIEYGVYENGELAYSEPPVASNGRNVEEIDVLDNDTRLYVIDDSFFFACNLITGQVSIYTENGVTDWDKIPDWIKDRRGYDK